MELAECLSDPKVVPMATDDEIALAKDLLTLRAKVTALEALAHPCPCCGETEAPIGEKNKWVHLKPKPPQKKGGGFGSVAKKVWDSL